ncbi:MAG: transporter substrate-binding domain-containing protein [Clostridia bacterium]|nr:transporter substrate-binding domain-containing protein [Clostridia bacterium]
MKKLLALTLVLMLSLTLFAACGEDDKLVVGITEYKPMDYKDEKGEWTGFDAEFAQAFGKSIDKEVEFVVIEWGNKFNELNSGAIDCIWNGMTITDEVKKKTGCSIPYAKNTQVVVMKADLLDKYQDKDSMKKLTFAVEDGSAGAGVAKELGFKTLPVKTQAKALLEVSSGTSDACIIDLTMAQSMTGKGTSYETLGVGISLQSEEYGIAFEKNSEMVEKINDFIKESKENGLLDELSEKYGVEIAK